MLIEAGLVNRRIVLFVAPYDFHVALSFANIPNVHPISFDQANAQAVIDILDRYSQYTCESAQIVTTESVGDGL
ncbi:MAG TPA: hypothetical protein PLY22_05090 [Fervidobacterium sp.]|nr:hypothetical protein [Fervidobacterium sp.]